MPSEGMAKAKDCKYKTIRDWPDCYEDCEYAGTKTCPHHRMPLDGMCGIDSTKDLFPYEFEG